MTKKSILWGTPNPARRCALDPLSYGYVLSSSEEVWLGVGVGYDIGDRVDGRYEILAVLGHGGMSEAYKARDGETGRDVVLKIPYSNIIGDPATFSRYQREMEIGKRLDHPNIQRLIAEGQLRGGTSPYMVLEYVEGRLLREQLAENSPLPLDKTLQITRQLVDALRYCHERGIVHRDLKPENVLITSEGQVKLVDFGIALLRGARRLTFRRLSNSVGTPDYMAPEQVRGERGDARTDVYSVGVMLFEMVTGEVPFQGDNALAVMSQRVNSEAPLLRRVRSDLPPQLEAVLFRALRRDPAERYSSMEELQQDLEHLDAVVIPDYGPAQIAPSTLGGFTSPWLTAAIIVAVFAVLIALGVVAELVHRSQLVH